jgi:hypothetical protein
MTYGATVTSDHVSTRMTKCATMTSSHISARMTYAMCRDEHLWNGSVHQRVHLSNLVFFCSYYYLYINNISYFERASVSISNVSIVVFWVVMPCGLVGGYQHFGGTYRLRLQGEVCNIF